MLEIHLETVVSGRKQALKRDLDSEKFDVMARLPSGVKLADVAQRGEAAGIAPERLDVLINALRNVPQVMIGKAVSRERADKAKALYEVAGISIVITPVLGIEAEKVSEEVACPGCKNRVVLTAGRQCPKCGVFVDKFTDEYLQKLREAELARAAIRRELEQEFEAQLDAAVAAALKEHGIFKGAAGATRGVGLVCLLAATFIIGRGSMAGFSVDTLWSFSAGKTGKATAMLDKAFPAPPEAPSSGPVANANAAPGGSQLDPDLDDPLLQQAAGRAGGKGISIEQAVAASRTLARAVGNTTADRALSNVPEPVQPEPVPQGVKVSIGLDLARQLAAMGQAGRATQVLKTLAPRAKGEPALASNAQAASIEVRAWSVSALNPVQAGAALKKLMADAEAISDAAVRVQALTQAGVALSQQQQLPRDAGRAFLTRAGETQESISPLDKREHAVVAWSIGLGTVLVNEANAAAKGGRWSQVRANAARLKALAESAPEPAQPKVLGMTYLVLAMAGEQASAEQTLDAALAKVSAMTNLSEQAAALRITAGAAGAGNAKVGKAVDALQALVQSSSRPEKAQALLELSLLHAELGFPARAAETADMMRQVIGSSSEALQQHTDLIVRSELVNARVLHGVGLYADAEAMLQRIGAYLL